MTFSGGKWPHKALVLGHIGIVRNLGRESIPVTVAREARVTFEHASRYCHEYLVLPNLDQCPEQALQILERYGSVQKNQPVVFLNGESDVLLFSRYRQRLSKYYRILLADDDLIVKLVYKSSFDRLAEEYDLPVPKVRIPFSREECLDAAKRIGFPCIMKPIRQRLWHRSEVVRAIGVQKALLIQNADALKRLLKIFPDMAGNEMIQEYVPGGDQQHFDFHGYIDQSGKQCGYLVGQKIRINPIHFGTGCYTQFVHEPEIARLCEDALKKIGYTGAANINLKRHERSGKYYILEINPRFSIWTVFDAACGVNLPLLQYYDALGLKIPDLKPNGRPQRWLWFCADVKAMLAYRKCGELTLLQWLKSYLLTPGKVEFHVFSWDDPLPLLASVLLSIKKSLSRTYTFLDKRLFGRFFSAVRLRCFLSKVKDLIS